MSSLEKAVNYEQYQYKHTVAFFQSRCMSICLYKDQSVLCMFDHILGWCAPNLFDTPFLCHVSRTACDS